MNKEKNIKFTVIIPTRERADTLLYSLKTVVSQDYDNFDIIVSDNFSHDNTKEVVDSFNDPRIRYINPGKRLSMSTHWEFALSHVKDGWITFLGDDDGLMPGALSTVSDIIKKTNVQAVTSIRNAYGWQNSTIETNRLIIFFTKGYEIRDGNDWIKKLMIDNNAICSDLPSVYTGGFVDIELINCARDKNGKFFLSTTPDVYSAISLASIVNKYVLLREPVVVSGSSHHSTGTSSTKNSNSDTLSIFYSENDIKYHESIIGIEKISSIPIGVYDCYLKSSFLHHDFLKVKLKNQLSFALSQISPYYYNDMIKYCKVVSERNNINFDDVVKESEKLKKQIVIPDIKKVINYLFSRRTIYNCLEFGVKDIYTASILAKSTYILETKYSHWKLSVIYNIIKTILNFRKNKNIKNTLIVINYST